MKRILLIGFWRIWKVLCRQFCEEFSSIWWFEILVFNRTYDIEQLKYLFKFDSVYWKMEVNPCREKNSLEYKKSIIRFFPFDDIKNFNLRDVVFIVNSTPSARVGNYVAELGKKNNIHVLHTRYDKDLHNVVYWVNDKINWREQQNITSSICDVSWTAAVIWSIVNNLDIRFMNFLSVHPALAYQNILDKAIDQENTHWWKGQHNLSRSFFNNIIPKSTSAGLALENIFTEIKGKICSYSIRIPSLSVTMADIMIELGSNVNQAIVEKIFRDLECSNNSVFLEYEQTTSLDFVWTKYLSIIYMDSLQVSENHVRFCLFYDNEWWYVNNVIRLFSSYFLNT